MLVDRLFVLQQIPFHYHFLLNSLQLFTMPKKTWTSDEQQSWLFAHLTDFRQSQEVKTTPSFFRELYENYHEKWPLSLSDADELSNTDGNEEKAKTLKQKASELVSGSFIPIYFVT